MTPRDQLVCAKGKGVIQTYWLTIQEKSPDRESDKSEEGSSVVSNEDPLPVDLPRIPTITRSEGDSRFDDKTCRMIDWNIEVLHRQLQKVFATRDLKSKKPPSNDASKLRTKSQREGCTVLDEVKDVIPLSTKSSAYKRDPNKTQLSPEVVAQLREYVEAIASMYRDNEFHSFEHASHVLQSVTKLLAHVVTADSTDFQQLGYKKKMDTAFDEYTHAITSDPIVQFACVFAALIHDVDHPGVQNAILVEEDADVAKVYKGKSVAEQQSVDLAWELLMEPTYDDLRACIYQTQEELDRFRQLIVNAVMATDIADKELGEIRKKRWERAFRSDTSPASNEELVTEDRNRKATIVIEHLIQASDVAHTMQHWQVYLKWNERLFHEMYQAYQNGRSATNPADFWYEGEIQFFDKYVIPLAKKLSECGAFGVASAEYLNYASANREEWVNQGKQVIRGYMKRYGWFLPGLKTFASPAI